MIHPVYVGPIYFNVTIILRYNRVRRIIIRYDITLDTKTFQSELIPGSLLNTVGHISTTLEMSAEAPILAVLFAIHFMLFAK